jgi:hypothetical protein
MNILKFGVMFVVAFSAFVIPAHADYNVWTDAKTGATVTFPDTWKQVNNELPIDLITLSVASGDDNATCRLRAEEDKRFMIYPIKYSKDIRDLYFSKDFWDKYTASYDDVKIIRQEDNAGLGQGFASMTLASYMVPAADMSASQPHDRGGLMAVTHYYDKVYVAECSSYLPSYGKYHAAFMGFFKSISFKKSYHELAVGDYRNFINKWGTIDVPFPNAVSRSAY